MGEPLRSGEEPALRSRTGPRPREYGEIRATAAILPLEVFVDGKPLLMGGIANVTTHAAYRRWGYAGELVRAALDGMRERGVHLSMLYPFYRRYSWELAPKR